MRKNTENELKAALRAAEAELAAATKRSALNAAARELVRAKEALKRFQGGEAAKLAHLKGRQFLGRHPDRRARSARR